MKRHLVYIFTIVLLGCTFPPLPICWDVHVIPKWYGAMVAAIPCILFVMKCWQSIRDITASEWIAILYVPSSICIYTQALYAFYGYLSCTDKTMVCAVGTYDTPGGLAFTVCLLLPFIVEYLVNTRGEGCKLSLVNTWVTLVVALLLLVLSKSRTGVIALSIELLVYVWRWAPSKLIRMLFVGMLVLGSTFLALQTKQDSTTGRNFILKRTIEIIADKPFIGYRGNVFEQVYMSHQQEFFSTNPDSSNAWLADNIRHPLNEFFFLWVNYGIIPPLLLFVYFIFLIVYLSSRPMRLSIVVLFVFCMFSYPLHYPLSWVLIFCSLFLVLRNSVGSYKYCGWCVILLIVSRGALNLPFDILMSQAKDYTIRGGHSHALISYKKLLDISEHISFSLISHHRRDNLLYNYAHELYIMGHLTEANRIIELFSQYNRNYDSELLCGDIYQALGLMECAVEHYQNAHYMCPVRFSPLYGLLQTYQQEGDIMAADSIAQKIVDKPVKVNSHKVERMKYEALRWLDNRVNVSDNRIKSNL